MVVTSRRLEVASNGNVVRHLQCPQQQYATPASAPSHASHGAAIAGPYAPLLARTDDVARFRIACDYLGAKLVSPASNDAIGYAYHDAGSSLSISIVWDNDHDTWYPHVEFAPDDTLRRDPFVPEIKL